MPPQCPTQTSGSLRSLQSDWFARLSRSHASWIGRVRRRLSDQSERPLVDGVSLREEIDTGSWRAFVGERPVHAPDRLYSLTSLGWYPVRYESDVQRRNPFLYLSLLGVREEIAIAARRSALCVPSRTGPQPIFCKRPAAPRMPTKWPLKG